uniref:Uncharacterized protein n=1 Tax=Anguilla anguilla TaxID=7936 RepID=A0A0E9RT98_ANGAN
MPTVHNLPTTRWSHKRNPQLELRTSFFFLFLTLPSKETTGQ